MPIKQCSEKFLIQFWHLKTDLLFVRLNTITIQNFISEYTVYLKSTNGCYPIESSCSRLVRDESYARFVWTFTLRVFCVYKARFSRSKPEMAGLFQFVCPVLSAFSLCKSVSSSWKQMVSIYHALSPHSRINVCLLILFYDLIAM